jgi:hypothetical protein
MPSTSAYRRLLIGRGDLNLRTYIDRAHAVLVPLDGEDGLGNGLGLAPHQYDLIGPWLLGLTREGLIGPNFAFGEAESLDPLFPAATERGCVFRPSLEALTLHS